MNNDPRRHQGGPSSRRNWLLIIVLVVLALAVALYLIETGGLA
jgi:hypothetical protein